MTCSRRVLGQQGTQGQGAGLKLSQSRLQTLWGQCQDVLEQPGMDGEEEGPEEALQQESTPEQQAALQRKLAALNTFGRIALQQVGRLDSNKRVRGHAWYPHQ